MSTGQEALIRGISNPSKLLEIEDSWNNLVNQYCENPFFLSSFITQSMESTIQKGWIPMTLAVLVDNKIVGIVPLVIKRIVGIRFARSIIKPSFSPDFIVNCSYRETCIAHILDAIFRRLGCHCVDFTLPAESPNLTILKEVCKAKGIHVLAIPSDGHAVLPIKTTWEEFEKLRGGEFRHKFKKIERKLSHAGSWNVACYDGIDMGTNVLEDVLAVDKASWKATEQIRRSRKGYELDQDLLMSWRGSERATGDKSGVKRSVWLLELNGRKLAYALVFQYKETAFIVKTSYDERFKGFYPGIYVVHSAIRDLFTTRNAQNIDFLSDLPFMQTWTRLCKPRVRFIMSTKRLLHSSTEFVFGNSPVKKIMRALFESK